MRKHLILVLLGLFVFTVGACGQSTDPIAPAQTNQPDVARAASYIPDDYCGELFETWLMVGQNMNLGTVTISNDEGFLYFDVALTDEAVADGWVITETHADIYTSLEDFPQTKKGNPKVGNFAYDIDSDVILAWEAGTTLCIAVHAALEKIVNGGVVQDETGWGDGLDFPGKSWAMYFEYTVQECWKDPPLPDAGTAVDYSVVWPATNSYFTSNISGLGPQGDWVVWDGAWPGWCVDLSQYINTPTYTGYLYSSYDDDNWPVGDTRFTDTDWPRINYILNHKLQGSSYKDVQVAMWYFTREPYFTPDDVCTHDSRYCSCNYFNEENVWAMINDALENGEGWLPSSGEIMLLIVYVNSSIQLTGIEVDP